MRTGSFTFFLVATWLASAGTFAALTEESAAIQSSWDRINYLLQGDRQADEMSALIDSCDSVTARQPDIAEGYIWCGIVKSTYAGMASSLSAMKYAKAARTDLERAIELDPAAMAGAAQTSLGTLYFKVPGWPIGFGDDKKARALLLQGVAADPDGIDSNYFYADFLYEEKEYEEASNYALRAAAAVPRPGRETADAGRRAEIAELAAAIEKKLAR